MKHLFVVKSFFYSLLIPLRLIKASLRRKFAYLEMMSKFFAISSREKEGEKSRKIKISLAIPQLNALNNEFFFLFFFELAIWMRVNKHSAAEEKIIRYIKFPKFFFVSTIFSYINKRRWAAKKFKNTRKEQLIDVSTIYISY